MISFRKEVIIMARGHPGRDDRGAYGGTRRRDGSGRGIGNHGTPRQPTKERRYEYDRQD